MDSKVDMILKNYQIKVTASKILKLHNIGIAENQREMLEQFGPI